MIFAVLRSLIGVLLLVGVVYGGTLVIPELKKQTGTQFAKVLGAQTVANKEGRLLADSLKKDTTAQIEEAKKTALHLNIADLIALLGRLEKIQKDAKALQDGIVTQIDNFTTH